MTKSPDAFRTISEVAEWLDRPAHVLRFWESKFTQVKPIKRAGGRRYYRPQDMLLLGGIKKLLHDDGMTIKGVQKMLRDQGVEHISALSQSLDEHADAGELVPSPEKVAVLKANAPEPESATLLQFPNAEDAVEEPQVAPAPDPDPEPAPESPAVDDAPVSEDATPPSFFEVFDQTQPEPEPTPEPEATEDAPAPEVTAEPDEDVPAPDPVIAAPATPQIIDVPVDAISEAGPGLLSRLIVQKSASKAADTEALSQLRGRLAELSARLSGN